MTETHALSPSESTADWWFANLDNRRIQVATGRRPLRILGVHRDGREVWIQLSPLDESNRDVVIRCWQRQHTAEILASVRAHFRTSRSTAHMIDVR